MLASILAKTNRSPRGVHSKPQEKPLHNIWIRKTKGESTSQESGGSQRKNVQINDTTYSIPNDLVKKHSRKLNQVIEEMMTNLYIEMKRTGRKVLRDTPGQTSSIPALI
tara:strand:+ start:106 stop:432 length:327 start_codon:yes stop_codon:yes gene_type:complete